MLDLEAVGDILVEFLVLGLEVHAYDALATGLDEFVLRETGMLISGGRILCLQFLTTI